MYCKHCNKNEFSLFLFSQTPTSDTSVDNTLDMCLTDCDNNSINSSLNEDIIDSVNSGVNKDIIINNGVDSDINNSVDSDYVPPTPPDSSENTDTTKVYIRTPKRYKSMLTSPKYSLRSQRPKLDFSHTESNKRQRSPNVTNNLVEESFSNNVFTVIDVSANKELFDNFTKEWHTKSEFSLSVACDLATDKNLLSVREDSLTIVGIAVCWGYRDAYYISLQDTSKPSKLNHIRKQC